MRRSRRRDSRPGGAAEHRPLLPLLFLAVLVPLLLFFWQGDLGWNWSDEGLHWYQIRRVLHGETPSADLHAYAPGRYLWGALFAAVRPDSLLAVRFAAVPFMMLGLLAGLWVLRRQVVVLRDRVLLSLVLALWMFPHYKVYDGAVSLVAVAVAARLAEAPGRGNCLAAGAAAGVFGFIGENHALYSLAAFAMLLALIRFRDPKVRLIRAFSFLGAGFLMGLVPYGVMALLRPESGAILAERWAYLLSVRAGSLPTPVPWPWTLRFQSPGWDFAAAFARGAGFVLIPLFLLGVFVRALRTGKGSPAAVVPSFPAAVVGLVYLRHAFSRPDPEHLAQGSAPFLLAAAAVAGGVPRRWKPWVLPLLLLYALVAVGAEHPGVQAWREAKTSPRVPHPVGRDVLRLDANTVAGLEIADRVVKEMVTPGRTLLAMPALSMVYAVHDLPSPIRGTYFLFPSGERVERAMIAELEREAPSCAILGDFPIDGREELRFSRTHPVLWAWLMSRYEPVLREPFWALYRLYRLKP